MNLDRHIDAHQQPVPPSGRRRRRLGAEAPRVLRRVSGGDGSCRRVLSADGRDRVRPPRAAEGHDDPSRQAGGPSKIDRVALLTVEGEKDDISGIGQTEAAHRLCTSIPADKKAHYMQQGVGHYGVFNGSRFRAEIAPRISDFMLPHNGQLQVVGGRQRRNGPAGFRQARQRSPDHASRVCAIIARANVHRTSAAVAARASLFTPRRADPQPDRDRVRRRESIRSSAPPSRARRYTLRIHAADREAC